MFDSNKDDFIHSTIDIGWNVKDNLQLLIENDFHEDIAGKRYYLVGPAIYWRQNDTAHYRVEFKQEINLEDLIVKWIMSAEINYLSELVLFTRVKKK